MKKVLIIAYYFPPSNAMGAQRPHKLAKYFSSFGWEPIILTVTRSGKSNNGMKIIEIDDIDITSLIKSRIGFDQGKGLQEQLNITTSKNDCSSSWKSNSIKLIKDILYFPDAQLSWCKAAYKSVCEFLNKEPVDAIISTSQPVSSHLIARKLKRKYGIPWIADLRDLWTQNPYINKPRMIYYLEKYLEVKTLSDANAIVTVTNAWISTLNKLHRNKKVYCFSNGYDEDDFPKSRSPITKKFSITYTGVLYNGKRDPSILFNVLSKLIKENRIDKNSVEVRFYGPKEAWLSEEIAKYELEGIAHQYGIISREEALQKQRESQLLLILIWNDKREEGFCPGKIYEYFGSKRPIVSVGWPGSIVKNILETTNTGKFASDTTELKHIIWEYYQEYLRFGEVKFNGNRNMNNYSYSSITQKYADILNKLVMK